MFEPICTCTQRLYVPESWLCIDTFAMRGLDERITSMKSMFIRAGGGRREVVVVGTAVGYGAETRVRPWARRMERGGRAGWFARCA